jgi:hypothetical protein
VIEMTAKYFIPKNKNSFVPRVKGFIKDPATKIYGIGATGTAIGTLIGGYPAGSAFGALASGMVAIPITWKLEEWQRKIGKKRKKRKNIGAAKESLYWRSKIW